MIIRIVAKRFGKLSKKVPSVFNSVILAFYYLLKAFDIEWHYIYYFKG
ncbi:hypothetical protein MNB_SM-6-200 [hydrothermal vent metagenome]|uniref:Uncharacterized protein n=1 Tax=hydrothermal vent metagenome TaxID=652676 RepID=A0A1W1CVB0_9ZZZZ